MTITKLVSAALILLHACVWSVECGMLRCRSGALFALRPVALEDVQQLEGATVEVCHNDLCGTSPLPMIPTHSHSGHSIFLDDPIHTYVEVWLLRFDVDEPGYSAGYTVEINIAATDDLLVDGDIYSATLRAADGSTIKSATFRATSHRDLYPNGEDCDERPCRVAVLARL